MDCVLAYKLTHSPYKRILSEAYGRRKFVLKHIVATYVYP